LKIKIKKIKTWEEYRKAWEKCAEDLLWIKEDKLLFYYKKEELKELKKEFEQKDNIFLVAIAGKNEKIIGCLGIIVGNGLARIRRWEPIVQQQYQIYNIDEQLLEKAIELLKEETIHTIETTLKYEVNCPESAQRLLDLFSMFGFKNKTPPAIQLYQDLTQFSGKTKFSKNVVIKTRDSYSVSDFCKYTIQAFATTEEDKKIHGWDPIVTNYDTCLRINNLILDGRFGYSPPEFWLVANVNDSPAGLLIAFAPPRTDKLKVGVIGELGVLPNFRGKGIASVLIATVLKNFIQQGYTYSYVGTPETNFGAINVYEKNGFISIHRVHFLTKLI